MNRLVLIGNGFDLAHGLKTRYEDFIKWYWDERFHSIRSEYRSVSTDGLCSLKILPYDSCNSWCNYYLQNRQNFFNLFTSKWEITGMEFLKFLKSKPKNFAVSFSPFLENICKNIETKGWVDVENEYYSLLGRRIASNHSYTEEDIKSLNQQLETLRNRLIDYLKQEQEKVTAPIDAIKDKIYKSVNFQEISVAYKSTLDKNSLGDVEPSAIMCLNFNYTNTPQQYIADPSKVRINYIHGNLENQQSIIFGYGDELDDNYKKLQNLNENECLRHIKSIRYMEADNYRKMLEFIESAPFQICIMGHSCGNSDRTLLNTLFEHRNCVSIKPYYYQKEDGTDNHLELVQNISRNFTDMKLMRDRVVNKEYCEPLIRRY